MLLGNAKGGAEGGLLEVEDREAGSGVNLLLKTIDVLGPGRDLAQEVDKGASSNGRDSAGGEREEDLKPDPVQSHSL